MRKTLSILILLALAACSAAPTPTAAAPTNTPAGLQPYQSPAPSATPLPGETAAPPVVLPSITPTPHLHKIKANETLLSLALLYNTSVEALMTANPGISPNLLSVGQQLVIPPPNATPQPGSTSPTPVALLLDPPTCYPDSTGGAWCFSVVHNGQDSAVESVILRLRVASADGGQVQEQTVPALLNRIEPGAALPVAAWFAAPLPVDLRSAVELVSSLPTTPGDGRFLPVIFDNAKTRILPGGMSAEVSGEVLLAKDGKTPAAQVWVAAGAYDAAGRPVGVRRWESSSPLTPGQPLPFHFVVYSAGGAILTVDLLVEARP